MQSKSPVASFIIIVQLIVAQFTFSFCAQAEPSPSVLLGAYYNDHQGGNITYLEHDLGHNLSLDFHYHDFIWGSSSAQYDIWDVQMGLTPLIAWEPSGVSAQDVINGAYDTQLIVQANQIRDLGVPVMMDFVPEMSYKASINDKLEYFYGAGWHDTPQGIINAGALYVSAQHHVADLFRKQGATNAQWVFGPSGDAFSNLVNGVPEWTYFYPGVTYVDWVGMDHWSDSPTPINFCDDTAIQEFYQATARLGKPLMIAQTAAHADPTLNPDPQTQWITSARSSIPTMFPAIHAFVWNNNTIRHSLGSGGDTSLYLQGKGLVAFSAMANDVVFTATNSCAFLRKTRFKATALDQCIATDEDTAIQTILTAVPGGNGNHLTYLIVTQPGHGTLTGSGTNRTYIPNPNYFGEDQFTFKVNDGIADSNIATVSIEIDPINDPPVAYDSKASTREDTPVDITLSAKDFDGDSLTYIVTTRPAHGTMDGTGSLRTYTPSRDYNGSDSFTFYVKDGKFQSNTATVNITVNSVNDAPEVKITSPADGRIMTVPVNNLNIVARASDVDGTIKKVDFYEGSKLIGTSSTDPYSITWSSSIVGDHTFKAVATDNLGLTTTSLPITIHLNPKP
jgi:hypothetical protein